MNQNASAAVRAVLLPAALGAALALIAAASLVMGFVDIPAGDALGIALGLPGFEAAPQIRAIVMDVRLPRILTSAGAGFGLGVAGAVFQGVLLNPLADPFTLGVSSGAAFGAALCLVLGLSFLGPATLPAFAFAGACLTLLAVLFIARGDRSRSPATLVLAGIITASILSAGLSFLKYLADERVSAIIFWLMGSFAGAGWDRAAMVWGAGIAGLIWCLWFARDLNVMSLGGRSAASLGVNPGRVRLALLSGASLVSAVCVASAGIIGFVGLVVPHLVRLASGPDNRVLLPASGLAGAVLLLAADTLTRAVLPHEVPIGVLTALIGGPVFCWLFRQRHAGGVHD